jgi:hypothetical protein
MIRTGLFISYLFSVRHAPEWSSWRFSVVKEEEEVHKCIICYSNFREPLRLKCANMWHYSKFVPSRSEILLMYKLHSMIFTMHWSRKTTPLLYYLSYIPYTVAAGAKPLEKNYDTESYKIILLHWAIFDLIRFHWLLNCLGIFMFQLIISNIITFIETST